MRIVEITIKVPLPRLFEWMGIFLVLLYRRLRYGYPFRRIKLTRGKFALVDPEDFERLNQYKWFCTNFGYASRRMPKKLSKGKDRRIHMHREVCRVPDGLVVDHINRNPCDNRKANLRPATRQQNAWNAKHKRKTIKTRYVGIHWIKNIQKWQVCFKVKGRSTRFGHYDEEIEAAKKYDEMAKEYRSEFAMLNFPEK